MKKGIKYLLLCVIILLLLSCFSGCAVSQPDGSETVGTVGDPFATPTSDAAQSTQSTESTQKPTPSSFSIALITECLPDEEINTYAYNGGEMCITFDVAGGGRRFGNKVGLIFFVDGIPQPYRTEQNDEYRYIHFTNLPEDWSPTQAACYFTPVTGQKGEDLELAVAYLCFPEAYKNEGDAFEMPIFRVAGSSYIRLNETPPPAVLPVIPDRQFTYSLSYTDLTEKDIKGWSEEDLRERVESFFTVNGRAQVLEYRVTKEDTVSLRFRMHGATTGKFSLVILVDNEPLYIDPERLFIQNESGKKLIIEMELDMSDFDGSRSISALLVPRNGFEAKPDFGTHGMVAYGSAVLLARGKK